MTNVFFNKKVDIYRLVGDEYGTTAIKVDVPCCIVPLDDSYGADLDGSYGKDFAMYTNERGILQEDRVVDGTDKYLVRGVQEWENFGLRITQLRIRKE